MLKERGAEKTGYRGCLIGLVVGGLIGAMVTVMWSKQYTQATAPDMPVVLMTAMFGSVGFVAGGIVGILLTFFFDLFTRKREQEEDEF